MKFFVEPGVIAVGYPVSPVHVLSNRSTTGECTVGNQPRARIGQPKNFRESPAEPKCTSTGNSPSDQIGFGRIWRDQTVERPETKINAAGFKMPSKNYSFLTYWIYPSNPRVNDLLESCGLSNVEDGAVQVLKALGSQLKLNAEIRLVESYGPPGNIM